MDHHVRPIRNTHLTKSFHKCSNFRPLHVTCEEEQLTRALSDRVLSLSKALKSPFKVNKPIFSVAPVPLEVFRHAETAASTLTCGYSISWNKSGLHEVILGTTGRKQGTSAKGAMHPSSESTLCKKRMLESFLSLGRSLANFPLGEISILRLKKIL
ncbi:tRNA-specific adenosine deaminase 1 [Tanacetum coccineum]